MIKILTKNPIADILIYPFKYIDFSTDTALLSVSAGGYQIMLLLGYDPDRGSFYFVLEDDEQSEDFYYDRIDLSKGFQEVLRKAMSMVNVDGGV